MQSNRDNSFKQPRSRRIAPTLTGATVAWLAGLAVCFATATSPMLAADSPVTLQWFECKWSDMEKKVPDWFMAGYGAVWLPPPSRCLDSTSVGYDPFDRFDFGSPASPTAYGTLDSFDANRAEIQRANGLVYIDGIYNHNGVRDASSTFQQSGGWPGFWLSPNPAFAAKQPTDNWGDFHNGNANGYLQGLDPNGANFSAQNGDIFNLIDISQESNNLFIRHPVVAGNPSNIPAGTLYNLPTPANAQFYSNNALVGTQVTNPGTSRTPGTLSFTFYPYDGMNGTPTLENAASLLMRWTQWLLDVRKIDGLRLDSVVNTPIWFWDQDFDSVLANRRVTPDGRRVNAFSFSECFGSNQSIYDNYIRKPNYNVRTGDSFANRDALDLNGAGTLRDLINASGAGSWANVVSAHLDNADGFNDGTLGVNHIFSHDNGSGNSNSNPPAYPSAQAQGMYAHAYLLTRPGSAVIYHNARGISHNGFWPRQGMPTALGFNTDPSVNAADATLTTLVQLHNMVARGYFNILNSTDPANQSQSDVLIYERRSDIGGGAFDANCLVAVNDRYDAGTDTRTVRTSFPNGTRLIELTGHAANPTVNGGASIPTVLTTANNTVNGVTTAGWVQITCPRNTTGSTAHNKGYLIYAPAIPSGTLSLTGVVSTIAADTAFTPVYRRRLTPIPVISGNSFQIQLTTTNGDPGIVGQSGANNNADGNAAFLIDQGFKDWNANGSVDFPYTDAAVPGYEVFTTVNNPLYGKSQFIMQGNYAQTIDAAQLDEGIHYLSVVAFRHRNPNQAPLFREFRQVFYIDRAPPSASIINIPVNPSGSPTSTMQVLAGDRTVTRTHIIQNLPEGADPVAASNSFNQCVQTDRFAFSRVLNLTSGPNRVTLVAFELSGKSAVCDYYINYFPTCAGDFNSDGLVDDSDFVLFSVFYNTLIEPRGDLNGDGLTDDSDFVIFASAYDVLLCP
ncbi:MAG: hypothetical protein KF805_13245 [Phycisphaeraceae bacterium]|nr:hypothetical protein [Phycisphaeraceae bacterium]